VALGPRGGMPARSSPTGTDGDGKVVNVPSYAVRVGDVVAIAQSAKKVERIKPRSTSASSGGCAVAQPRQRHMTAKCTAHLDANDMDQTIQGATDRRVLFALISYQGEP